MSRPGKSDCEKHEFVESFEERIDMLFEELSFAIQWQRPSILLAFYETKYLRDTAELMLELHLAKIGQQVVQFTVDEKHFDIPLLLSKRPDRDRSVYFVTGLGQGGGKEAANAYRALNMRREYFVDYAIRVILWLEKGEEIELSRHAPDFWAFRHRVVEFYDSSGPDLFAISADGTSAHAQGISDQPKELDKQITRHEALLGKLPKKAESLSRRLDLVSALASLYLEKKAYDLSIRRLKQGILIAKQLNDTVFLAKFWGNLGFIYLQINQPARAVRAHWKAIRLTPQDASLWNGLGQTYLVLGRVKPARSAFKKAARVKRRDENT
jgi:tetratricopeptide (TPR) repeat protein